MNSVTSSQEQLAGQTGSERRSLPVRVARSMLSNKIGAAGFLIILVFALAAVFAPALAPEDPNRQSLTNSLDPPSWMGGTSGALFGTDYLGRDVFSRVLHGARVSLIVGVTSVILGGVVGTVIGLVAAYRGRAVDSFLMRLADFQLSIPFIVLAVAILGVLGPGVGNIVLVLGITAWVTYARVVRGEALSAREQEYVLAARSMGASGGRIMYRHLLPNVFPPTIVIASLEVARMIIAEASLSFLGLGVPSSVPSWGSIASDGRDYLQTAWWISTFPGLAIVLAVLGINLFGDWLRDELDPKLRGNR